MWTGQYAPQSIDELCVAPKKCKQVQEWLSCESTTVGGMLILVGSPGIGKSTMAKLICNDKFHEWVEEPGCFSPIQSFIDFLHQAMYLSSDTVVLLDDLPYLHNEEMKERFRKALGTHVQQCPQKTIWIYSQTKGGQHQPKELESLLDSSILYHSGAMTTILQIHPVTQAKMKKVLQKVCKANRVTMPDISMYQGDLRHALLSLQFSLSNVASSSSLRDTPLSPFHALGKLLYAKRRVADGLESPKSSNDEQSRKQQQQRPPLEFVPEQVVEQSGMPLQASIYFLEGHAPDFFTDIEELSRAFGSYSDAAMFMQGDHRVSEIDKVSMQILCVRIFRNRSSELFLYFVPCFWKHQPSRTCLNRTRSAWQVERQRLRIGNLQQLSFELFRPQKYLRSIVRPKKIVARWRFSMEAWLNQVVGQW